MGYNFRSGRKYGIEGREYLQLNLQRVTSLRKNAGLSQKDMADILGISQSSYQRIESGKTSPNRATAEMMAHYFNSSVEYICGKTNDPRPKSVFIDEYDQDTLNFLGKYLQLDQSSQRLIRELTMKLLANQDNVSLD